MFRCASGEFIPTLREAFVPEPAQSGTGPEVRAAHSLRCSPVSLLETLLQQVRALPWLGKAEL